MEFLRQEYWSGLPCLPPGDLPDPGIEPTSLLFPTLAGRFFTTAPPGNTTYIYKSLMNKAGFLYLHSFLLARIHDI